MAENVCGWTGTMLRVDLSSGEIKRESDAELLGRFLGGAGAGMKVLFDEVEPGTAWDDPNAPIALFAGMLTGTGTPAASLCTWTHLSSWTEGSLPVSSQQGGMLGAELKYAGYDGIIIEGEAAAPVVLRISDDDVSLVDARRIWGLGTREAAERAAVEFGVGFTSAMIGPAGEAKLPCSTTVNARSHAAEGGVGANLGAKRLKGIAVRGTHRVGVAHPAALGGLSDYAIARLVGACNGSVVPATSQSWSDYHDSSSMWSARKGLSWGAAEGGAVETGECRPGDPTTVGLRSFVPAAVYGDAGARATVKMSGCHGCPVRCHAQMHVQAVQDATGYLATGAAPDDRPTLYAAEALTGELTDDQRLACDCAATDALLDLGLWDEGGQLFRDLAHVLKDGSYEREAASDEYGKVDWAAFGAGDPKAWVAAARLMADGSSKLSELAGGTLAWAKAWGDEAWIDDAASGVASARGWSACGVAGPLAGAAALGNVLFDRDPQAFALSNLAKSGLPKKVVGEIAGSVWGGTGAFDGTGDAQALAEAAWWGVTAGALDDALGLCPRVWPFAAAPEKKRSYQGDVDAEKWFYEAVSGKEVKLDDLYAAGARIVALRRLATARGLKDTDLAHGHDVATAGLLDASGLSEDGFSRALSALYERFSWDGKTGCPTASCAKALDVADEAKGVDGLPEGGEVSRGRAYDGVQAGFSKDAPSPFADGAA